MSKTTRSHTALALATVALVAACGGESNSPLTAQELAAADRTDVLHSGRLHALAAGGGSTTSAAANISNDQLFQWARLTYPDLFPGNPTSATIPYQGKVFDVRSFANGNNLGVADGEAYGLGPFTGGNLQGFGAVQTYAEMVCSKVNCAPTGGGGGGGGTGSLNGCTIGASEALRAGNTYTAEYTSTMLVAPVSIGQYSISGVVNGGASFEGQSAVKTTTTTKGKQFGFDVDATIFSYQVAAANDLIQTLGTEFTTSFSGFPANSKLVYAAPASLNSEYTLAIGSSLTKTETATTTISVTGLPLPIQPTTSTTTTTHTFEGRETISVLGRTYDTCRYRTTTAGSPGHTLSWLVYGKGFAAKAENYEADGTAQYRAELKSATINGAPL